MVTPRWWGGLCPTCGRGGNCRGRRRRGWGAAVWTPRAWRNRLRWMVSWETYIPLSRPCSRASHPEICCGDQSSASLTATTSRRAEFRCSRQDLGRQALARVLSSAAAARYRARPPCRPTSRSIIDGPASTGSRSPERARPAPGSARSPRARPRSSRSSRSVRSVPVCDPRGRCRRATDGESILSGLRRVPRCHIRTYSSVSSAKSFSAWSVSVGRVWAMACR